jgi:hypothetical protein
MWTEGAAAWRYVDRQECQPVSRGESVSSWIMAAHGRMGRRGRHSARARATDVDEALKVIALLQRPTRRESPPRDEGSGRHEPQLGDAQVVRASTTSGRIGFPLRD